MIKKLSHVSLLTKDLNKIYKFYVKILGLKVIHKFENNRKELYGLFLYAGKGTFIEFFKSNKKKLSKTYDHICFEVDNIYETKKNLIKLQKLR
jgi:catechol 2,3-dioxygenase-like lactoylglutathione lyase family enzyme